MENNRFGTREVIEAVIGTIVFIAAGILINYLYEKNIMNPNAIRWICGNVFVLTMVSMIAGPIVGIICAFSGCLILELILMGDVINYRIVLYMLYAYIVGRYSSRLDVCKGNFDGIKLLDYNVIHTLGSIVCYSLMYPVLMFVFADLELKRLINIGVYNTLVAIALNGIIGTPILYLISRTINKKKNI